MEWVLLLQGTPVIETGPFTTIEQGYSPAAPRDMTVPPDGEVSALTVTLDVLVAVCDHCPELVTLKGWPLVLLQLVNEGPPVQLMTAPLAFPDHRLVD
jgi:hypothetical protein